MEQEDRIIWIYLGIEAIYKKITGNQAHDSVNNLPEHHSQFLHVVLCRVAAIRLFLKKPGRATI